jgi:hypothetical protein
LGIRELYINKGKEINRKKKMLWGLLQWWSIEDNDIVIVEIDVSQLHIAIWTMLCFGCS